MTRKKGLVVALVFVAGLGIGYVLPRVEEVHPVRIPIHRPSFELGVESGTYAFLDLWAKDKRLPTLPRVQEHAVYFALDGLDRKPK